MIMIAVRPMNNTESWINHRRSIRLPGYDYTQPGAYFITICAASRRCIFGEIVSKDSGLSASPIGKLVINCWRLIPLHFSNVILDEFVLMPNHLHGILQITECRESGAKDSAIATNVEAYGKPVPHSIPTIIRSFKSIVSRRVVDERLGCSRPIWQRNYYEHVVRTESDLSGIRQYISEHPSGWSEDSENPAVVSEVPPP